ncbi:MAG TPA: DUF5011 domain-containing protein [Candidatus Hydrogenedentes bacterium]|nr:DUF5011 domain-containing protein [Candidatus Hydrogenedentota bacterium]
MNRNVVVIGFILLWGMVLGTSLAQAASPVIHPNGAQKLSTDEVVIPPTVVSIVPITASPTNLEDVEFRATFSEPVLGVDITDFVLDSHNLVGEYITGVSGSLNVYTITVHSGNGEGVMDVDLVDDDTIVDLDSNPLGGPGLGNGDYYNDNMLVIDRRGPVITLSVSSPLSIECGSGPFSPPSATATDGYDGDVSANILVTGSVDPDTAGSYLLTYSVDDSVGNHSEEILEVIVGPCSDFHSADQNGDNQIGLSELLRVIQFFNSEGYHCDAAGEDGYNPGPGDTSCAPHHSDYASQDWHINLSELLRIIQFFNSGGYHACTGSEDGFCPGL